MTTDLRPVTGIVGLGTVGEAFLSFLVPPGPGGAVEPVSTALTSPAAESAAYALINGPGLTRVEIGVRSRRSRG
ncbi:hypothetical protein [Streptomyces sp. NPDC026589]|uniref:hypothetical protein n=1 Tax=Streptomyces sp. NPDC026589 TaxID=3155609 RepID=UPI0033FBE8CA